MSQLQRRERLSRSFEIVKPGETVQVRYHIGLKNRWAEYGLALFRESDSAVITADDGYLGYYYGYEGGEHWTEGSRSRVHYWKVKTPGRYRILTTIWETDDRRGRTPVRIQIDNDVQRSYILLILALLWPILPFYLFMRRRSFESRRWQRIL